MIGGRALLTGHRVPRRCATIPTLLLLGLAAAAPASAGYYALTSRSGGSMILIWSDGSSEEFPYQPHFGVWGMEGASDAVVLCSGTITSVFT